MEKILNILGTLQQKLKQVQAAGQQAKGLKQKELEEVKTSYSKYAVPGEAIDRAHSFLVRLLENNPDLVKQDDFISEFEKQLEKPFVDLMLELDQYEDKMAKFIQKDNFQNMFNEIVKWVEENKTIEMYDLCTKISSVNPIKDKLVLMSEFLEEIEKELPDDTMRLKCVTVAKVLDGQALSLETEKPVEDIARGKTKEKDNPYPAEKEGKSIMPVVGMIVSGIVGLFGLYKSVNADEKSLPYGLTILGLIGFGASAIWKWGWPKLGGGEPMSDDDLAAAAVASMAYTDGHWGHSGDCGYGGDGGAGF